MTSNLKMPDLPGSFNFQELWQFESMFNSSHNNEDFAGFETVWNMIRVVHEWYLHVHRPHFNSIMFRIWFNWSLDFSDKDDSVDIEWVEIISLAAGQQNISSWKVMKRTDQLFSW